MSDKYKGCQECFYYFKEHNAFPCNSCERYSHYIHKDVYTDSQPNEAWKTVVESLNGLSKDDWPSFTEDYNVVSKPKHYMLFPEKGIEVRDVIEKLVLKLKQADNCIPLWESGAMFESDYVQMMQYLMRFMDKNGVEDLRKARWYLDKLIEAYDA